MRAYEESAEKAADPQLKAKALANLAAAKPDRHSASEANRRATHTLAKLPDSHEKAALLLTIGRTWLRHEEAKETQDAWKQAGQVALRVGDEPMRSYALGFLGELFEAGGQYGDALKLTREAAFIAQKTHSSDALFRWEWQKGRLFAKLGADSVYRGR